MALQFPNSPTHGQSYQTGSSATYIYNSSGSFWALEIGAPTTPLYTSLSQSVADRITTEAARISTLETDILGYELKGRNLVSGSSQLTGSLNLLYAASGAAGGGVSSYTALTSIPVGIVSGSSQLTSSFPSKTTGAWSVPAGASTQSFSVESGASYTMWVNGNIPNGIITWNATVTTANTNVPAAGSQYGWYYTPGNALVLTAIPDQIIGTNGSIANTPTSYAPNTSNVFKFGITNNSGTTQTINYGYIKLS